MRKVKVYEVRVKVRLKVFGRQTGVRVILLTREVKTSGRGTSEVRTGVKERVDRTWFLL